MERRLVLSGHTAFTRGASCESHNMSGSSSAVKKGEIPVLCIGRRAIVPRVALEKKLASVMGI